MCEHKTYTTEDITIEPANFPGPIAVEIDHDFEPFVDYGVPGTEYTIKQYMENAGMVDQLEWVCSDPNGQDPNRYWMQVWYEGKCYLQKLLDEHLGSVLHQSISVGPFSFTFADIALTVGGIRISDQNRRIDFLIPSLLPVHDDTAPGLLGQDSCTDRTNVDGLSYQTALSSLVNNWYAGDDKDNALLLGTLQAKALNDVDFPKLVHHHLQSSVQAQSVGLKVACSRGIDCSLWGPDNDPDNDGFCNYWEKPLGTPHRDYCPDTPTSANCDWDGDGSGDGTTHLVGRPASLAGPAREPHCLGYDIPPMVDAGQKTRERLLNFACGGCDNCGRLPNPDTWLDATQIPHTVSLPAAFQYQGALPIERVTWQPDLDNDWVGDACDPDVDGDGVRNEFDCGPMNDMLGIDLDGDQVCDDRTDIPTSVQAFDFDTCFDTCWANESTYRLYDPNDPNDPNGTAYLDTGDCVAGCWVGTIQDNCAPAPSGADGWCDGVKSYCLDPDEPVEDYEQHCTADVIARCAMQYANPVTTTVPASQPDSDGDGIGDKCDHGAFGLELVPSSSVRGGSFGPTVSFGCYWHGETYTARMRVYGGNVSLPSNPQPPHHIPETATAFEVGACACTHDPATSVLQGNLDWSPDCWNDTCPNNNNTSQVRGEEDASRRKYWNPLSVPDYAADHAIGCGLSSICARDATNIAQTEDASLVYGRSQELTRDESANQLALGWSWKDARKAWWPAGTSYQNAAPYLYRAGVAPPVLNQKLITRARATWPSYLVSDPPIVYDYDAQTGVSYSPATFVDEYQGSCFGEVYLGSPFVVTIIPGVVDFLWGLDGGLAWRGGAADLPGSGLSRREVAGNVLGWSEQGELVMYRHGTNGLSLRVAQRFAGAGLDKEAGVAATIGAVDGALWSLPAGRHQALLAYQQPYREASPDPWLPGPLVPSRLTVGRLSEGEVVTLEDAEALSGRATPSLFGGRVVFRPRGQELFLIGRLGSDSGPWRLARLSLAGGGWSAERALPLANGDLLLAARLDPLSRRVLLLVSTPGGISETGREAVLRVLWLDPTTLAVTEAAPTAPPDLARSRAAVYLDPAARQVWIAGGERDGTLLGDVWRLDLGRRVWTPVATMPTPLQDPLVYWDAPRRLLWLGEPRTDAAGLDVWAYDPSTDAWVETSAPVAPTAPQWPVDDAYVVGRTYAYPYAVGATTALPGDVVLGRLAANAGWLGLTLRSATNEILSVSEEDSATGDDLVAALCPPGETCDLVVRAEGGGAEAWVPFTVTAEPATLTPYTMVPAQTTGRALTLRGDLLYLVGPQGVRVVRTTDLATVGWAAVPGLLGGKSVALCGSYLCVVRPDPNGFVVVDVTRTDAITVVGRTDIGAKSQGLAVWGGRAFVARGSSGVRVVDISNPLHPVVTGSIDPGGKAVSVAVQRGLLAVGLRSGAVKLYDLSGAPVEVGAAQAGFQLSEVRFVAGQLWALDKQGQSVEAWRVTDPAVPVQVGTFQGNGALLMTGRWRGTRLYAVDGHYLHVLQAQ